MKLIDISRSFSILVIGASLAHGVLAANIASVPVSFSVKMASLDTNGNSWDFGVSLATSETYYYGGDCYIQTDPEVVTLEPGRPYTMVLEAAGTLMTEDGLDWMYDSVNFDYEVNVTAESGYVVRVGGVEKGYSGTGYGYVSFTVSVGWADECAACGPGSDYSLRTDQSRLAWAVKMGRDINGGVVDPISLATEEVTTSTFSRAELNFVSNSSSVVRVPSSGTLNQVVLPNALVDAVDVTGGFELNFYPLAAKGTWNSSTGRYAIVTGYSPYVTYRFRYLDSSADSASLARIGATTEEWLLARYSGRWRRTRAGVGVEEVTAIDDDHDLVQWKNDDGTVVEQVARTYTTTITGQRELISSVDGEGRETTWSYYGETTYPGSRGKLNLKMSPEGDYSVYTYWNEDGPSVGKIARIYQPYADAPTVFLNNHETLATGRYSDYVWAADINGVGNLLASRTDYVNVDGTLVVAGRRTGSHSWSTYANDKAVVSSIWCDYSISGEYTTTIEKTYAPSTATDELYHDKEFAIVYPDRTQVSYVQQRGTWNGSDFTESTSGSDWRTIAINGFADAPTTTTGTQMTSSDGDTIEPIYVVPARSTKRVSILDNGNLVREELYICSTGTTFVLATQTNQTYTQSGDVQTETRIDPVTGQSVVIYDSTWSNGRKTWDRDSSGVQRSYSYDAKGRVSQEVRSGVTNGGNGLSYSQTTDYTYDAADNVTRTAITGGLGGTLVSQARYDLGGRVLETEEPGGRITHFTYDPANRTVTKTFPYPGGATTVQTSYRDGRLKDLGGTAVVRKHYLYAVESDGREKTTLQMLDAGDGTALVTVNQTWEDWGGKTDTALGRRGSDDDLQLRTNYDYDTAGRLIKTELYNNGGTQIGHSLLRGYDPTLGFAVQAVDVNANGAIDEASMDRITVAEGHFVFDGSCWWLETAKGAYDVDSSATARDVAVQQTRLNGFSSNQLYQVRQYDAIGQLTTSTTTFDFSDTMRTLATTVDLPGVTNDQVTTICNGRVASVQTAQGITYTSLYDQFGRVLAQYDPRKGWSVREYMSGSDYVLREQNEADYAAGRYTATYAYDDAGMVESITDALGQTRYIGYTARGEVEKQWGSAAMPVMFEYNARGQRTKMHTYRGGSGWDGSTWPSSPGTADTTEWVYATYTGLLLQKRDAQYASDNARKVAYTYTADGLVATRAWARGVTTAYSYNDLREVSGVDYSDSTTDVTGITYNRRGQVVTVTDATGERGYYYDTYGQLVHEALPSWFGSRVVDYDYDAYGRRSQLGLYSTSNGQSDPTGALFTQGYNYDAATARLSSLVSWSGVNGNSASRTTSYSYHTDSNQIAGIANSWADFAVERTLDDHRDAVAAYTVGNAAGTYEAIAATYTRDALGRIEYATLDNSTSSTYPLFRGYSSNEGLRFGDPSGAQPGFTYNARGEVTQVNLQAMVGSVWQSTDLQGMDRLSTFSYDNAQNRETGTAINSSGVPVSDDPTPDSLNQPGSFLGVAATYDKDGNLTSDGIQSYTYDAENRLIQSTSSDVTLTYVYDYMGRRVEMYAVFSWGSYRKRYIWDGWHVVADLWASYENAVANTFVWGPDVSGAIGGAGGIGGLVVQYYNSRAFLPLDDGRGNIYGYLDTSTGLNAVAWGFTPFGETVHERGGITNVCNTYDFPFRYQSKMQDPGSPLLYYGYRYLHPGMGRFINRDPIGEAGGLNLHAFVGNNPANFGDVLGLESDADERDGEPSDYLPIEDAPSSDGTSDDESICELDPFIVRGVWTASDTGDLGGSSQILIVIVLFYYDALQMALEDLAVVDDSADVQLDERRKRCAVLKSLIDLYSRIGREQISEIGATGQELNRVGDAFSIGGLAAVTAGEIADLFVGAYKAGAEAMELGTEYRGNVENIPFLQWETRQRWIEEYGASVELATYVTEGVKASVKEIIEWTALTTIVYSNLNEVLQSDINETIRSVTLNHADTLVRLKNVRREFDTKGCDEFY